MLRFPSEALWLALGARQVGLARRRRGRAEALGWAAVAPDPDGVGAILAAAAAVLEQHAPRRARVHAVLSDRLVRYALMPFSRAHLDAQEERALCLAGFAGLYGAMDDWPIALDRARFGQARLACALAPQLAHGLAAVLADGGFAAGAIVPHFVSAWNARRKTLSRRDAMLAVAEADSLVIGRFDRGWRGLRAHYIEIGAGGAGDLDGLLLRERLHQQCAPDTPVWLCGSAAMPAAQDAALQAQAPLHPEPGLAMALAAASA